MSRELSLGLPGAVVSVAPSGFLAAIQPTRLACCANLLCDSLDEKH